MGFQGFEMQPGMLRVEAWPALDVETQTSYAISFGREQTIFVTDVIDYDEFYRQGEFFAEEGTSASLAMIDPDHVIYPSAMYAEMRTVRRRLSNGHVNALHLYPVPVQTFYFMAGELHALLHGPGTIVASPDDEVVGPAGPEEDYAYLKVCEFINRDIRKMTP